MGEEEPQAEGEGWGVVLQCGATDFYSIGRTKDVRAEYPNLLVPSRLKALAVRGGGGCGARSVRVERGGARAAPPTLLPPLRVRARRASR